MTPQTIVAAAKYSYSQSSQCFCAWDDLPASRRRAWITAVERLVDPEWRVHRGERIVSHLAPYLAAQKAMRDRAAAA
jgi:hypothetical protein